MSDYRQPRMLDRALAAAFVINPCPSQPPYTDGPRLFLEVAPGGAVYQQDSTHCVVAEGWAVYWRVRRNETDGESRFRVRTQAGTASEGSDFRAFDRSLALSPGEQVYWSPEWGCPSGTTVPDDTIPEPDEQFTLLLESTTPGVGVDSMHAAITVTIVDDDDPPVNDHSFHWPLRNGLIWTYWNLWRSLDPDHPLVRCGSDTSDTQVTGETVYGDRTYRVIGPSSGYEAVSVAMEGARAWIIPPHPPEYPPQVSDTIAVEVWETYPRLLFDGSQPDLPCASGFADHVRGPHWGGPRITDWNDRVRCEGSSVVATPAGVFHHVIRVVYGAEWRNDGAIGAEEHSVEVTYWIADSVGVVARTIRFRSDQPVGLHSRWSGESALIGTSEGPVVGNR